jgi:sugar/nucleoside kinase (ribokinase family)
MHSIPAIEPIDYLIIGHLTRDLTPKGARLGGTAAYSALTARALGLQVGMVTAWGEELPSEPLDGLPIVNFHVNGSTTFENINTPQGRIQRVEHVASKLFFHMVPESWRKAKIVHLGPVAQEVDPGMIRYFSDAFIGVTPQGWLRAWDESGHVRLTEWPEASFVLGNAQAVVLSFEDVGSNENRIEEMATYCRVLAVTEGKAGARLYWHGDVRRFRAPEVTEVDATGSGDIFAASFFYRLLTTRDPWEAARFATQLASYSVTRPGLEGIPTKEEIDKSMVEVI